MHNVSCELCSEPAWRRLAGMWVCHACTIRTMEWGFDWRYEQLDQWE